MPLYSHSKLSTYENCPRQFRLKYIDRIEPPEGKEGIEAFLGSRVHEALEEYIRKTGIWEGVSGLNLSRLVKLLDDEELDAGIRKGLLEFAAEMSKVNVRLVKKRELEE